MEAGNQKTESQCDHDSLLAILTVAASMVTS